MGKDSLIQAADPQHKYLRQLLGPAFSPEATARYLPEITALMQRHLQEWADAGEAGVKGLDSLKLLTFEFIVQVGVGISERVDSTGNCV
jgi:cytochrome P450